MLGVSADSPAKQKKFKEKHSMPFDLIADEDHKVCEAFGVWKEKSMYGKKYMGIERTTFVINSKGKVVKIFEKVKPDGHADEVLAALKE